MYKTFDEALRMGIKGEGLLAKLMTKIGMPYFDARSGSHPINKGPRLYDGDKEIVVPDYMVIISSVTGWNEFKTKTGWTRLRKKNRDGVENIYQTGTEMASIEHYSVMQEKMDTKVILSFLQLGGSTKDTPEPTPAGLFCITLDDFKSKLDHTHTEIGAKTGVYGNKEMGFINIYDTVMVASLEDVLNSENLTEFDIKRIHSAFANMFNGSNMCINKSINAISDIVPRKKESKSAKQKRVQEKATDTVDNWL